MKFLMSVSVLFLVSACSQVIHHQFVPYDSETHVFNFQNISKNMSVRGGQQMSKVVPKARSTQVLTQSDWRPYVEVNKNSWKKNYQLEFRVASEFVSGLKEVQIQCPGSKGYFHKLKVKNRDMASDGKEKKEVKKEYMKLPISPGAVKRLSLCDGGKIKFKGENGEVEEEFTEKHQTYFKEARFVYLNLTKDNFDQLVTYSEIKDRSAAKTKRGSDYSHND